MTIHEAHLSLYKNLLSVYSENESRLISKYIVEDLIDKDIKSKQLLNEEKLQIYNDALFRILNHEPWQYITGEADFYGHKFYVDTNVLIPRPETEELVHLGHQYLKVNTGAKVLDIGTGSGIIAIMLAKLCRDTQVTALDISATAIGVAKQNADRHRVPVEFKCLDFLDEKNWAQLDGFDLIISNPPYIGEEEITNMSKTVINYEPHTALFAGNDSMVFYKAIAKFVRYYQNAHTKVMVEINEQFGKEVVKIFEENNFSNIHLLKDMQGKDRMVSGEKM